MLSLGYTALARFAVFFALAQLSCFSVGIMRFKQSGICIRLISAMRSDEKYRLLTSVAV